MGGQTEDPERTQQRDLAAAVIEDLVDSLRISLSQLVEILIFKPDSSPLETTKIIEQQDTLTEQSHANASQMSNTTAQLGGLSISNTSDEVTDTDFGNGTSESIDANSTQIANSASPPTSPTAQDGTAQSPSDNPPKPTAMPSLTALLRRKRSIFSGSQLYL